MATQEGAGCRATLAISASATARSAALITKDGLTIDGNTYSVEFLMRDNQSNINRSASVGQELIQRGEVGQNAMSADAIRDWCAAHPDQVPDLLATNPSFVFFRLLDLPETLGPIGASGVPLTPLRSLAADPDHIAPGTPVWVECGSQQALFIAQDTGSAIKGPGRIDLFCGSGAAAGRMASGLNAQGTIHVLRPKAAR